MLHNKLIKLKIINKKDFVPFICLLYCLAVISALLSSHAVVLTISVILLCAVMWTHLILNFSKSNNMELTSVIFADGRVRLESNKEDSIEGFLVGQQWYTRWLAVLQFSDGEMTRKLVVKSAQQHEADDFRRLSMWLRHCSWNDNRKDRAMDV
jgi:hypothetical protein